MPNKLKLANLTLSDARIWFRYRSQILKNNKGNRSSQWEERLTLYIRTQRDTKPYRRMHIFQEIQRHTEHDKRRAQTDFLEQCNMCSKGFKKMQIKTCSTTQVAS